MILPDGILGVPQGTPQAQPGTAVAAEGNELQSLLQTDTSKMSATMKNLAADTVSYAASNDSQTKNFTRGKKDYSNDESSVS